MKKKEQKIFKYKNYSHFDNKKEVRNWCKYVESPEKICVHGFYPFIHFIINRYTYDKSSSSQTKKKPRDICYSSHIDRYIYEYYNYLLNEKYNSYAKDNRINRCAVAYRNNIHQNNMTVAREVFNFIKKGNNYFILISDFSKYFDTIDHVYLKKVLKEVLEVDFLPEDWYKVFRSVTKYSFINFEDIVKSKNTTPKEIRMSNRLCDSRGLHDLKKFIHVNKSKYGIPQGSSISSTLSNINLIHYDTELNDFITAKNGLYKRYCDDLIVVIPIQHKDELLMQFNKLNEEVPGLTVNPDKNQIFL
jgi:hypothetical protein